MPTPIPPGFTLGTVEPKDAMAAFAERGLIQITFSWMDLWNEEHTRAFTISRLTEERLLEFIRDELASAVQAGTRFEEWAKRPMAWTRVSASTRGKAAAACRGAHERHAPSLTAYLADDDFTSRKGFL